MSFLVLPSQRVLMLGGVQNAIRLTSLRAQQLTMNNGQMHNDKIAVVHHKTLSVFAKKNLEEPIISAAFPKKITCASFHPHLQKPTIVVSDKFGDIYEVSSQKPVYLNSNLGIPSFLHCYKDFLILGDELSKIKIYNLKDSHEIFSIWYIVNSQPLELKQMGEEGFLLLSKYQNKEQLHEKEQIYWFTGNQLKDAEFPGTKIYEGTLSSFSKASEIKSSTILPISSQCFFYVSLYTGKVVLKKYSQTNKEKGEFKVSLSREIPLELKTNPQYLSAVHCEKSGVIVLAVGRQCEIEGEISEKLPGIETGEKEQIIQLNENECIIAISTELK